MKKATVVLENGDTYDGFSFGAELSVPGEVGRCIAKIMMETSVFRVVNNLVYGYPNVFSFRTVRT